MARHRYASPELFADELTASFAIHAGLDRHGLIKRRVRLQGLRLADRFGFLQQQARFDTFLTRDNEERPHHVLAMRGPAADDCLPSVRPYQGLGELEYRLHD